MLVVDNYEIKKYCDYCYPVEAYKNIDGLDLCLECYLIEIGGN